MIDRLISALRAPELGLDLDWRDLADVLWLATAKQAAETQRQPADTDKAATSTQTGTAEPAVAAGPSATGKSPVSPSPLSPGAPRARLQHPGVESLPAAVRFGARDEPGLGLDVEAPVRHALTDRESIGRALRPFMRRRPSSRRLEFDADATVSQYCDTGVLAPVMRPAREHWFDIALVIDGNPTMVVWQETAAALSDLLERHGAFRAVTRWHLSRDASGRVCLRTPSGLWHSPSVLDDAADPSIVLVLTDCVGDLWSSDSAWSMLRDWGRTLPVAILQPLPERAWSHTRMGDADIAVRSHRPGQANATLERSQPWWWDSDEPLTGVVPVVTLSADSVGLWARMVMGTPGVAVRALSGRADDQASPLFGVLVDDTTSIARLAELLRSGLSSTAYELAIRLSAVDLSLPIAHIVMDRVLPQAREQHLAELLISGVLRVQGDGTRLPDATNTAVPLAFPGRVRETLQQSLTTTVALSVWRALVPYLEATGQQPQFSLVLDDAAPVSRAGGDQPAKASDELTTEMLRIAAQVAARLGFEQRASLLRAPLPGPAPDLEPQPAPEDTLPERPGSAEDYLDFDVAITREGAGYDVHVVSPVGEASAPFVLPFSATELAQFMIAVEPPRVTSAGLGPADARASAVQDYGRRLGDALLTGPVQVAFTASLDAAVSQGNDLRVRLRLDAVPELDPVPWEYLYDSRLERFLTLSQQTPVVRLLDSLRPPPPVTAEAPLRVLVIISSPSDMPELAVDREKQLLLATTADMVKSGKLTVTFLGTATLTELQRALLGDYHVFHFIGHSSFDDDAQEGVIVLEREDGTAQRVSGARLGMLLHDARNMQLAVLNASEGSGQYGRNAFSGVGRALVRQGLPAVVAVSTEISDRAALIFSHELYWSLTQGLSIDAAISEVRLAMAVSDKVSEWGTPALYRNSAESRLSNRTPPPEPSMHSMRMVGHTGGVTAVATTRLQDGRVVAVTGGRDATVRMWDLQSTTPIGKPLTGHADEITGVATAAMPDGRVVAVTGSRDATVRVWDLQSGSPVGDPFPGHDSVTGVTAAVLPTGRVVAVTGGRDAEVRTWDLQTGTLTGKFVTGHTDGVTAVVTATLPDGRIAVVTGGLDPTVRVCELTSGMPIREPITTEGDTVRALATAQLADGRLLAVAGADDRTVHVLDLLARRGPNRFLSGHSGAVEAVATAVLTSGRVVAVTGDTTGALQAWDLQSMTALGQPLTKRSDAIWALSTAELTDGRVVAVAGRDDGTVEVVNLAVLELLASANPSEEVEPEAKQTESESESGEAETPAEAVSSSSVTEPLPEAPPDQTTPRKGRIRRLLDVLAGRDLNRPDESGDSVV